MSRFKSLPLSYQVAFVVALLFHASLLFSFVFHKSPERPVMQLEAVKAVESKPEEIVKARSVDAKEVAAVVERLKNEREAERVREVKRKQEFALAEKRARDKRIAEERRLAKLKAEQKRLAEKRQAELEAEKKRLKAVQAQKAEEAKRLETLKQEQVALKKKQEEEKAREMEQARAERAREEAERRARVSGVVDKYKALILGAISQQWILPDEVNPALSSQFKIRLAPNGSVLDVQLTRSSGDPVLDRSAEAAIYKASPLPVPGDADMFKLFREISLTVRPENVRG